ncbi:Serine/threonine-protein kinase [Phytophthora megakarya]|uniref:Serine/threonine-protein kinase n=1 Tax=Phytophthora megakarya TaxID=4795 RepID=A0A225W2W9_9STRA|nr:Serine/threonine-protein kinase [Phytophthora megakarya]
MHIKKRDIFRFTEELSQVDWNHHNLVQKGCYFERKPPVSASAFIGINGIVDFFSTDGTFDRVEFTKCCQAFLHSPQGHVRQYPGRNSVWILDGAAINRHPEIMHFLRSVDVVVIFLPAYCPFFNPIEFMFGYVKRSFQCHYIESSNRDLVPFVVRTFRRFKRFNMKRVFEHCGYRIQGVFDPVGPLSSEKQSPRITNNFQSNLDSFDFIEIILVRNLNSNMNSIASVDGLVCYAILQQ